MLFLKITFSQVKEKNDVKACNLPCFGKDSIFKKYYNLSKKCFNLFMRLKFRMRFLNVSVLVFKFTYTYSFNLGPGHGPDLCRPEVVQLENHLDVQPLGLLGLCSPASNCC